MSCVFTGDSVTDIGTFDVIAKQSDHAGLRDVNVIALEENVFRKKMDVPCVWIQKGLSRRERGGTDSAETVVGKDEWSLGKIQAGDKIYPHRN